MSKSLTRRIALIFVFAILAIFLVVAGAISTMFIGGKIRMWILTRNMTGGTSLVYEIDTKDVNDEEKKNLSQKMIAVLKRRVDPAGIMPLIWRPLGDTRFEILISPAAEPSTPQNLQRMLKGAGVLEFRILPTQGHPEADMDRINTCVERLKEKGPQYASDTRYIWCEIENIQDWHVADNEQRPSIVAQFGDKFYVLASQDVNETMLHAPDRRDWKLEKSYPTTDSMGRRAIGFLLDDRGGNLFANVTGKNIDRPLCILLDGVAMSAPLIQSRIYKQGVIVGNFSQTQVQDIVNKLNAGTLPARLIEQPISVKTIGLSVDTNKPDDNRAVER
jgi:preprotein translocase subunit SecD